MRLCLVTSEYAGVTDYWGGIGAQYACLAPELAKSGHEIHVLTLPPSEGPAPTEVHGVRVHAAPGPRAWPWRALARARAVDSELRRLGPFDAVVAPEYRGEASLYARSQRAGPLVTHLLTSTAQLLAIRPGLTLRERHGPNTRLTLALERRQAERSTALVAPGSAILEWARALWNVGDVPAGVIPLCIDVAGIRAAARAEPPEAFPRGHPLVAFASRLDGHKGAQHLVEAMSRIWEDDPSIELAFIGRDAPWRDGMMSDHLREVAGRHAGKCTFMGYVPDDAYFACVARSDILAIPSLWESFCIAAVEVMALGRPLIGTSGHGFSEFVENGENGLLVSRGSVDELECALRELLASAELRASLGSAAGATADRLDASAVAPAFVAGLERVLREAEQLPRRYAGPGGGTR